MRYGLAESSNFRNLITQVEITMDEMLSRQYVRFCPTDAWKPKINIYETDAAFEVCVDIAGMKSEAIGVHIEDNCLVLRGERPRPIPEEAREKLDVHLMEIDTGVFCRQIELPRTVDRERITARYRDGMLWIELPKVEA